MSRPLLITTAVIVLAAVPPVRAVVFYDSVAGSHNTTAPGGAYADSGWQYQGYFGGFLGTAIGSQYFITAQHIGVAGTFVQDALFTGQPTASYTVDTTYNSGAGFYDVPGSDLRIFKITGTFPEWAPLYTGSAEAGKELVVTGRGGPRGADVTLGPDLKGWLTGASDGTARWGRNEVGGVVNGGSSIGDLLYADFDALPGQDEAHLSVGDSGGAVFINDGGTWKLAGINYAVDGAWDLDSDHSGGVFNAALFDAGGLWVGGGSSWQFVTDTPADVPSSFYASRISAHTSQILAAIPEPSVPALAALALAVGCRRRRGGIAG